jgi:hypothetical protein
VQSGPSGTSTQNLALPGDDRGDGEEAVASNIVVGSPDRPMAVFLFYTDGSGLDAYPSLDAVRGEIEAVDVDDGAYDLFTDDGRVIEARSGGRFGQDVFLHITENRAVDELERRVRGVLSAAGLDPSLASRPIDAARELAGFRSRRRWWPWGRR